MLTVAVGLLAVVMAALSVAVLRLTRQVATLRQAEAERVSREAAPWELSVMPCTPTIGEMMVADPIGFQRAVASTMRAAHRRGLA